MPNETVTYWLWPQEVFSDEPRLRHRISVVLPSLSAPTSPAFECLGAKPRRRLGDKSQGPVSGQQVGSGGP